MSDRTCATCKRWKLLDEDGRFFVPEWDPALARFWGRCERAKSWQRAPVDTTTHAFAREEDGYDPAELLTTPDFGCNQWEAKS